MTEIKVTNVTLNSTSLILTKGESAALTPVISPSNASNKKVIWTTNNPSVALVNNGVVNAAAPGQATIIVTTDDGGKTSTCSVTVKEKVYAVESVSLNKSSLTLTKGNSETLTATVKPDNATNKNVTWSSNNNVIVTVSSEGEVKALNTGKATVTVTTIDQGKTATCAVEVSGSEVKGAVDLGLSVLWASCNLGATKPEEYGWYFAWGDVFGQSWNGWNWSGGGFSTFPKYELDENGHLKPEYDAAHVLLGGTWRMPSKYEMQELINNCTISWASNYNGTGIAGFVFTSKKAGYSDKSIFLPAAGYGYYYDRHSAGINGRYWTCSFCNGSTAYDLDFEANNVRLNYYNRRDGQPIRPVSNRQ